MMMAEDKTIHLHSSMSYLSKGITSNLNSLIPDMTLLIIKDLKMNMNLPFLLSKALPEGEGRKLNHAKESAVNIVETGAQTAETRETTETRETAE